MSIMDLIEVLNSEEKLIIYGNGNYANLVLDYLEEISLLNRKVLAIVVTKKGDEISRKIPVKEITELSLDKEIKIFVATAEDKHEDIMNGLHNNGFQNIIPMSDALANLLRRRAGRQAYLAQLERRQRDCANELKAAINLNRALEASDWCMEKDFTTSAMAVDNRYLYFMYRILDSRKFHNILDIGMGQTSKMIAQYVCSDDNAYLSIVDDDSDWIEFFSNKIKWCERIKMLHLPSEVEEYKDGDVLKYQGFSEVITEKYDYISIDAPKGRNTKYSRVDILDVLPACLKDSFVIMIHDTNRIGEINTENEIKRILEEKGIKFEWRKYSNIDATFTIIASYNNRFFCTV